MFGFIFPYWGAFTSRLVDWERSTFIGVESLSAEHRDEGFGPNSLIRGRLKGFLSGALGRFSNLKLSLTVLSPVLLNLLHRIVLEELILIL